jgi:hypothetical protein
MDGFLTVSIQKPSIQTINSNLKVQILPIPAYLRPPNQPNKHIKLFFINFSTEVWKNIFI